MSGAILGDGYFHARQCESIINQKPNKKYYNSNVNQDCDRCLRYCPKGEVNWKGEIDEN
jgi:epoxyqueuosine reductase QueG